MCNDNIHIANGSAIGSTTTVLESCFKEKEDGRGNELALTITGTM